jgi:hypothetical protein
MLSHSSKGLPPLDRVMAGLGGPDEPQCANDPLAEHVCPELPDDFAAVIQRATREPIPPAPDRGSFLSRWRA